MNTRLVICASFAAVVSATVVSCEKASPTEPAPICTFTISPTTATIESAGGNGTLTVTVAPGCAWTATPGAGWIAVSSGGSGNGSGTVTYSIGANPSSNARTGNVTVAGQIHSITQQGRPAVVCTYEVSPPSAEFTKDGGAGTFSVNAPAECSWTAASDSSWVTINGNGHGTGASTVSYTVARSTQIADRIGIITLADRRFAVKQAGDVGGCQYSVAPVAFNACLTAGTLTATLTTQDACPWTATPNAQWLNVASGTSGNGSATISINYSDNYDAPREGTVVVRWPTPTAGQNVRVAQAGCRYAVSRSAFSFSAAGGTGTFDVIQQSDPTECGGATQDRCLWTAQSQAPWITITSSMPRSGDNPVAFSVAVNDNASARIATIIVRDQVVTITQAGR